jgi:hypothetical protein
LRLAVGLVDRPTFGTCPAGVARIDDDNRDAFERRLVTRELAKLSKRPPTQAVALRLSGLSPPADMRQMFDRNRLAGAFGVGINLLGDAVVDMLSKAGLLSAKFLQTPLGGLGTAVLRTCATNGNFPTNALDLGTGIGAAIAVIGKVHNPAIKPEHIDDADLRGIRDVTDNGEIPCAADQHQIDLAFAKGKQSTLTVAADERNLHSTSERPDADRVADDKAQYAIVVWLGGMVAKRDQPLSRIGRLRRMASAPLAMQRTAARAISFASRIGASCQLKNRAAKACCSRRCGVQVDREATSPALPSTSIGWSQRVSRLSSIKPFVLCSTAKKGAALPPELEAWAPCFL